MSTREPTIMVNGTLLSEGQAMAVRVAVTMFHMEVSDPEKAADLGPIASAYRERLEEVLRIIL